MILVLAVSGLIVKAQTTDQSGEVTEQKQQNIEALKVAFISKELELTPAEAEKFWPVYNQYSKELKALKVPSSDEVDVLDRDEKVLNLRKSYKDQFTKLLGAQRMNRLYGAEGRFRQVLIKAIKQRRAAQQIRPRMRRN